MSDEPIKGEAGLRETPTTAAALWALSLGGGLLFAGAQLGPILSGVFQ